MNIVDLIILVFIILCILGGIKRGVIRETVNVVGNFLVIILSFLFMGSVANILYQFLPFLNLGLFGISLSALNIVAYQIIAFMIVYVILNLIYRLIFTFSKLVDKLLNSLIIFTVPSKIFGGIVGLLSGYITVFVILIILAIPLSTNSYLHESKVNNFILSKTPILTKLTNPLRNASSDIYSLGVKISKDTDKIANSNEYNLQILDIMLKYDIISVDTVDSLTANNKLNDIKNLNTVVDKYKN